MDKRENIYFLRPSGAGYFLLSRPTLPLRYVISFFQKDDLVF